MKSSFAARVGAATWVVSATAFAAPPDVASIDRLLAATHAEKQQEATFAQLTQLMRQTLATALKDRPLTVRQQRVMEAAPERFAPVMREALSWDQVRPLYVQVYQETFTQDEVDGLIAFYGSPTGQAFVEKMPTVVNKTVALTQLRMAPLLQKMQAAIAESVADVDRAAPPSPGSPRR